MQPALRLKHLQFGHLSLQILRCLLRRGQSSGCARYLLLSAGRRHFRFLQLSPHTLELGLELVEILLRKRDLCASRAQRSKR